jgi:8-hydroxy-5-deazaflavin:NADPH oxidoreductase
MKIAILGIGNVGQTFVAKLIALGHEVMMGTRNVADTLARKAANNYGSLPFGEWHKSNEKVQLGSFAETVVFGEIILNALQGTATLTAINTTKATDFYGKILLDNSNPLDFSKSFPPTLLEGLNNSNSLNTSFY